MNHCRVPPTYNALILLRQLYSVPSSRRWTRSPQCLVIVWSKVILVNHQWLAGSLWVIQRWNSHEMSLHDCEVFPVGSSQTICLYMWLPRVRLVLDSCRACCQSCGTQAIKSSHLELSSLPSSFFKTLIASCPQFQVLRDTRRIRLTTQRPSFSNSKARLPPNRTMFSGKTNEIRLRGIFFDFITRGYFWLLFSLLEKVRRQTAEGEHLSGYKKYEHLKKTASSSNSEFKRRDRDYQVSVLHLAAVSILDYVSIVHLCG